MKRFSFLLLAVMALVFAWPVTAEGRHAGGELGKVVSPQLDVEPSFKGGGTLEFSKWVGSHLKYPKVAKENGIQGRVLVAFTVGADGRVKDVKVVKGVDKSLDDEAVRVVSKSPRWKPGYSGGKPVNVSYSIPVSFNFN